MPTADSLSFEILKTGENQVKILVITTFYIGNPGKIYYSSNVWNQIHKIVQELSYFTFKMHRKNKIRTFFECLRRIHVMVDPTLGQPPILFNKFLNNPFEKAMMISSRWGCKVMKLCAEV